MGKGESGGKWKGTTGGYIPEDTPNPHLDAYSVLKSICWMCLLLAPKPADCPDKCMRVLQIGTS